MELPFDLNFSTIGILIALSCFDKPFCITCLPIWNSVYKSSLRINCRKKTGETYEKT